MARAVDKGDLDAVAVHPLPAQERILEALLRLGFRFSPGRRRARPHLRRAADLPFYQEIEFYPPPQYAAGDQPARGDLRRRRRSTCRWCWRSTSAAALFTEGHDAFGRFTVDYATVDRTDWAAQLDGWLRQSVQRRGLFF